MNEDILIYEILEFIELNYVWKFMTISKNVFMKIADIYENNINKNNVKDVSYIPSSLLWYKKISKNDIDRTCNICIYTNFICDLEKDNASNYIYSKILFNKIKMKNWFFLKHIDNILPRIKYYYYFNDIKRMPIYIYLEDKELTYEQCEYLKNKGLDVRILYINNKILDDIFILDNTKLLKLRVQHINHYVHKLYNNSIYANLDKDKYIKLLATYIKEYMEDKNKVDLPSLVISNKDIFIKLFDYLDIDTIFKIRITEDLILK